MKTTIFSFTILLLIQCDTPVHAGDNIYAGVLQTRSYIVGHANDPSGLYLYQSDSSWKHFGWNNVRLFGIAIDPQDGDHIFLACGNGVMRSTNAGKTWKITTDWRVTEVLDIAIDPTQRDNIYAATAYGVWHSSDSGETWQESNNGITQTFTQTIQVDKQIPYRVICGGEGGLYLSSNGGKQWQHIGPDSIAVRDIHQNRQTPDHWLIGTEENGLYISQDNGLSWSPCPGVVNAQTLYAVTSHPQNPLIIAAAGFQTGVCISNDGGESWNQYTSGLPIPDIHALQFEPTGNRLWAGSVGAGVFYSDNLGKKWIFAGLDGAEVWDMIITGE